MGTATLAAQPLAVTAVCRAAGLVACGCGQATAGHGPFKDSLRLKLWLREGGGHLGLGVSRVPGTQAVLGGLPMVLEAPRMVSEIVRGVNEPFLERGP